jgi:hypothetical protein
MMKKIADAAGGQGGVALEYLREQDRIEQRKSNNGFKIGGPVNVGVGLGLMALLRGLIHGAPVYLAGTIPLFVGIAPLIYAFWMAPDPRASV